MYDTKVSVATSREIVNSILVELDEQFQLSLFLTELVFVKMSLWFCWTVNMYEMMGKKVESKDNYM